MVASFCILSVFMIDLACRRSLQMLGKKNKLHHRFFSEPRKYLCQAFASFSDTLYFALRNARESLSNVYTFVGFYLQLYKKTLG